MTKKEEAKAEAPKTEVAVVNANTSVSTEVVDLEADAGMGLSGIGTKDLMVPYFGILQALSPQLQKQDPLYIKGAEQGMFHNSASGQTYDGEKGVIVILCDYTRRHTEWNLREKGGGFIADHGADDSVLLGTEKDEKGRDLTSRGTQVVVSGDYPAIIYNEETGETTKVLISMSGTQLKKARKLNNLIDSFKLEGKNGKFTPAIFTRAYKFTTVPESNEKGSWYGFKVEPYKMTTELPGDAEEGESLYLEAKSFSAQIRSGAAKVNRESGKPDSEIPF